MAQSPLPLLRGWTKTVPAGVLHTVAVAAAAMTSAWSKAASSRSSRTRALAEIDRLGTEIALLKEELEIKGARFARVPARRTPLEVYQSMPATNEEPRFEPRAKWPRESGCARPVVMVKGEPRVRLQLVVSRFENRPHLPVVDLQRAS